MKKARLTVRADITIDESEFAKISAWDVAQVNLIIQEMGAFELKVKSASGIKLNISVISPTDREILKAVRTAGKSSV